MKTKRLNGPAGIALAMLLVLTSLAVPVLAQEDDSPGVAIPAGPEQTEGGDQRETEMGDNRDDVTLGNSEVGRAAIADDAPPSPGGADVLTVIIEYNAAALPSAARGDVSFEGEQLLVYAGDGSGDPVGAYTITKTTEPGSNGAVYYALVPDLQGGDYTLQIDTPRVTAESNAHAFTYTEGTTDIVFEGLEFIYNPVTYRVLDAVTETWPSESEVLYGHYRRDPETGDALELGRWWVNRSGYYLTDASFVYGLYSIHLIWQWMDPWMPEQYPPYTELYDTTYCHYTFAPTLTFAVDGAERAHGDSVEFIDYAMPHSTTRLRLTDGSGNPIAGAQFALFDPQGNTFAAYDDYGRPILMGPTYTTDDRGVIEVYGPFRGEHRFRQLTTAEGFAVLDDDIVFSVSAERFKQTDSGGDYLYWDDDLASGDWHHGWFTEVNITNTKTGDGGGTNPPGGGGGTNPPTDTGSPGSNISDTPVPKVEAPADLVSIPDSRIPIEALPDTGAVPGLLPGLLAASFGSAVIHGPGRRRPGGRG